MNHQVVTDYTNVNTENSSVCVYVRARPPNQGWTLEDDDADTCAEDKFQNPLQATLAGLSPKSTSAGPTSAPHATNSAFISNFLDNPKKISIKDPSSHAKHHGEINFSFDKVFWTECSQEEIFQAVAKPQVENILNGFNCCCFAYGQTGSGKTYSMFGEGEGNSRGMIPRCMEEIFSQLEMRAKDKEVVVVVSFLEIYCDQVRDLGEAYMSHGEREVDGLKTTSDIYRQMKSTRAESFQRRSKNASKGRATLPGVSGSVWDSYPSMDLKIHEDVQGNVFVKELSLIPVTTLEEVLEIISLGLKLRATHETKMNQVSSRSHTVFTATVVQKDPFTDDAITGILNLVDLAGSERLKKSASEGQRKTEALHINSSLTALGKVVMALDPSSGLTHIPYRDSKLTRLLQNSLGGNSYTVLLATVHPISRFYEECLSTLQFANRCRSVHNNPRVNKLEAAAAADPRKLKKLQDEIAALRMKLAVGGGAGGVSGAGGVDPNARVMAVLAQVGLTGATELPDGSIRLPDGRIVGDFSLGGETDAGDASDGKGRVGVDPAASRSLQGLPTNVGMIVERLEAEVRSGRENIQKYKKEIAELHDQLKKREATFARGEKDMKQREQEMAGRLSVARARLDEVREAAAKTKEEQLAAVLAESQVLLRRQRQQLLTTSRPQSALERRDHKWEKRSRRQEHDRHAESMEALEFSKEVETESLRQKCQRLAQLELRSREIAEAKLEQCRRNKAREVRQLSVELLLLYDHALSLCNSPQEATSPTTSTNDDLHPSCHTHDPATSPLSPNSASLFQLHHFPRLAKLLSVRREDPERLIEALSKPVISANGGRVVKRWARPKSAGAASSSQWKRLTPSPSTPTLNGPGRIQILMKNDIKIGNSTRQGRGRSLRPTSAPGRRRAPACGGRERESDAVGSGGRQGGGKGGSEGRIERVERGAGVVEWTVEDEASRGTRDLSSRELTCLVERLRKRLDRVESEHSRDHKEHKGTRSRGQAKPCTNRAGGREFCDVCGGGVQAVMREQTRRYNDLRVAYQSLSRRLEGKGETKRTVGGKGSDGRLRQTKFDLRKRKVDLRDPTVRAGDTPEAHVNNRPCGGAGLLIRSIGAQ